MTYTLVPLGNPGKKYENTRHNAGRIVARMIKEPLEAYPACKLFIPDGFMNESGRGVSEYLKYNPGKELIIIYDDKDLPYGTFRISHDRGDGGHNGVKSVIESLGTKEFTRIRIGIAPHGTDGNLIKPPHGEGVQEYVMGKVTHEEMLSLKNKDMLADIVLAIKSICEEGYKKAMEKFN